MGEGDRPAEPSSTRGLANITREEFEPHQGGVFAVELPSGGIELTLISVDALTAHGSPAGRTPFSLVFRGPPESPLAQGTYRLAHDAFGRADIFLVPIQPDEQGPCYEAVFA